MKFQVEQEVKKQIEQLLLEGNSKDGITAYLLNEGHSKFDAQNVIPKAINRIYENHEEDLMHYIGNLENTPPASIAQFDKGIQQLLIDKTKKAITPRSKKIVKKLVEEKVGFDAIRKQVFPIVPDSKIQEWMKQLDGKKKELEEELKAKQRSQNIIFVLLALKAVVILGKLSTGSGVSIYLVTFVLLIGFVFYQASEITTIKNKLRAF